MPGQRQDYILQQIELLRQFVARLIRTKESAGLDDMLQLSFSLQEKLFARPPAEFLQLEVNEQISALMAGESHTAGQEKCLTYGKLLADTATLYQFRGRDDLAFGARQLALHVILLVVLDGADVPTAARTLVDELKNLLIGSDLHPPVRELLGRFDQREIQDRG
jgi:hypothetical protein